MRLFGRAKTKLRHWLFADRIRQKFKTRTFTRIVGVTIKAHAREISDLIQRKNSLLAELTRRQP